MSNGIYASLARQVGLAREMEVVANNIANVSTTGYRSDRAIFSEYIVRTGQDSPSLSMGSLTAHAFDLSPGDIRATGGRYDFAIQGEGFFLLETERGQRLTRSGAFELSAEGNLVTPDGDRVLGFGGNEIAIPEGTRDVTVASDGAISADGQLLDRLGIVRPEGQLQRDTGTLFISEDGTAPFEEGRVLQGALEQSNVSPVLEVARMIEVQRAYEAGQTLLEKEDQRLTQLVEAVRQSS